MKIKALDLFCGAGGTSKGLVDAGFERIYTLLFSWIFILLLALSFNFFEEQKQENKK